MSITFNGVNSDDLGVIVERIPNPQIAARRANTEIVPGRNGALLQDDGSFATVNQMYEMHISAEGGELFRSSARNVAAWLLSKAGFLRLEDSYEPDVFRLARYSGGIDITSYFYDHGRFQCEFECQPQRFLKSGETPISYEGDSSTAFSITNPTQFEARPLLKFVDTSTVPEYVSQALTMREDYIIDKGGNVIDASFDAALLGNAVSNPVNCSGKANARITGNGYAFLDSNGKTRSGGYRTTGTINYSGRVVSVPSWAETVVVSNGLGGTAALALQEPRANPGAAAVTINSTIVNLDFSAHDTIYLDCDLHDAYYADGSSANSAVSFSSSVDAYPTFPGLSPGVNTIIPGDGSILDFELTPRWWLL